MSIVGELVARSNRLGSDPRNTNYAGGSASAKGTAVDPITGKDVELLWVKGSGGDLGTLTPAGVLDLPPDAPLEQVVTRLRELHAAYRADYAAYYQRYAGPDTPPMRADPAIVLVPGIGMSATARTSRPPGWPGSSTSTRST
jgi:rhamnose utilization protein RhaD (predicted bifunctional aldolase and dehydrogenase)